MAMTEQTETRTRREAMQRVQVGLIGLGGVLLVVAFANVVAKMRPEGAAVATVDGQLAGGVTSDNVSATGEAESMDDLGVTPAPSVPDLEPDPRLRKPMDRDPNSGRQSAPQR
jgi:hypothetical protein